MLYLWDFYQPKDVVTPRVPLDRFCHRAYMVRRISIVNRTHCRGGLVSVSFWKWYRFDLVPGTFGNLPSFQSRLACSILALELETKFHQMCRSPSIGAPPMSTMRASAEARKTTSAPFANT